MGTGVLDAGLRCGAVGYGVAWLLEQGATGRVQRDGPVLPSGCRWERWSKRERLAAREQQLGF